MSELLGNQQLAGDVKFLPLQHKQKEGGRVREGSPGGCLSQMKWRHPACSVWAAVPPPPRPYRNSPPRHIILRKPLATPRTAAEPQLIGRKHRLVTACVDTWSIYVLVLSPVVFCSRTKGASECLFRETSAGKKWTFCPIDGCKTLTQSLYSHKVTVCTELSGIFYVFMVSLRSDLCAAAVLFLTSTESHCPQQHKHCCQIECDSSHQSKRLRRSS